MMNKTTNANRITLWTSIDLMLPCIKAKIRSELSSFTENKVTALMYAANFKHFEEITYKLSKVSVGQPIIAVASFTDTFNEENNSNAVKVIDSGNLGECFDMDLTLRSGISTRTATFAHTILTVRAQVLYLLCAQKRCSAKSGAEIFQGSRKRRLRA